MTWKQQDKFGKILVAAGAIFICLISSALGAVLVISGGLIMFHSTARKFKEEDEELRDRIEF